MNLLPYLITALVIWFLIILLMFLYRKNVSEEELPLYYTFMIIFTVLTFIIITFTYGSAYVIQGGNYSTLKYVKDIGSNGNKSSTEYVVRYGFQTHPTNGEVVHSDSNLIILSDGSIFGLDEKPDIGIELCKSIEVTPSRYVNMSSNPAYIKSIPKVAIKQE